MSMFPSAVLLYRLLNPSARVTWHCKNPPTGHLWHRRRYGVCIYCNKEYKRYDSHFIPCGDLYVKQKLKEYLSGTALPKLIDAIGQWTMLDGQSAF